MSKISRIQSLAMANEMKKKGKKLFFVQTEYVKYPFIYVWASGAKQAEQFAKDSHSKDFFDFPARPRKWEITGEVEPLSDETVKELDLYEKEHPEADKELILKPDEIPTPEHYDNNLASLENFAAARGLSKADMDIVSEAFVKKWLFHRAYGEADYKMDSEALQL